MDVSDAVDTLFAGVVPERIDELKRLWGEQEERVRLLDAPRFLLQQLYGTVQVSELALRQIWLTGYAGWRAVEAYNVPLTLAALLQQPLDVQGWHGFPSQAEKDDAFDELFDKIQELGQLASLEAFEWPDSVPYPAEGLTIVDPAQKGTFDLICIGGAYVFAHEVRHSIFEQVGDQPDDIEEEERECDRWALSLILDRASQYALANGWSPSDVRAKRILGVLIAKLAILALTPRRNWDGSGHPPVRERLRLVLDAAVDPVPDWFWATVSSMLLAFARKLGIHLSVRALPPTHQRLSYELCDLLIPE